MSRSQQAYASGDGGAAHSLSEEGKSHGQQMAAYNRQASEFIFRENNAPGRVAPDTIDLHGQFVEEAEDILEERIKYARAQGQNHLHVIVGKGNHSPGHIQKIKPKVEEICRRDGLQFHTEPNAGRIYVNLTGGPVDQGYVQQFDPYQQHGGVAQGYQQQQHQQQYQQQHYGASQQHHGGHQQQQHHGQQSQNEEIEKLAKKFLPRILRYLQRLLCN